VILRSASLMTLTEDRDMASAAMAEAADYTVHHIA
jgi:hypothetical protein